MQVYIISDRRLRPDLSLNHLVDMMAGAGADMMQIREKDLSVADLLACVGRGVAMSRDVYVNGRADVALAAGAAGVHLPAAGVRPGDVRRLAGSRLRVGVSTHSRSEAVSAESEGADFITFGPVFETESKRRFGPAQGVGRLEELLMAVKVPVFAIGGINQRTALELKGLPIAGIAVISAVLTATDPAAAVAELRGALR